ncbi:MAG: hypothetical protein ACRDWN_00430, partial [Acidimicrobiales bacterium]
MGRLRHGCAALGYTYGETPVPDLSGPKLAEVVVGGGIDCLQADDTRCGDITGILSVAGPCTSATSSTS